MNSVVKNVKGPEVFDSIAKDEYILPCGKLMHMPDHLLF